MPAYAVTFCVDSGSALRAALETSENNGADDVIRIVQGVYSGGFDLLDAFVFEGRSVTMEGGYSNGCVSRNPDPVNTVIESSGGKVLGLSACVLLAGCESGDFTIDAITLRGGVAREGGALTVFTAGSVTVSNSILTGNRATAVDGGAVNVAFPLFSTVGPQSLRISDSEISDNIAAGDGGGVWVGFGKTVSITDSRITSNSAAEGGGIFVGAQCAEIVNNVIDGNVAQANEGGGLLGVSSGDCGLLAGDAWLISGNQITNNTAQLQGGGVSMRGTASIIGNVITGNSASSGGGLRVAGPARVVNNLLVDNTGDSGAGAALFDSVDFINNTVAENVGTEVGGVWARLGFSDFILNVINNIMVGNTGPVADLQIIDDQNSVANILNNDFDHGSAILAATMVTMQDNLDAIDPQFVDAAGADYRLKTTSSLVNAGTNVANLPETDLLGNQRIAAGRVDIGAYEVVPTSSFIDVPTDYWAFSFIETLAGSGITAGCGGDNYCPEDPVTRAQMAVFLERGMNGSNFSPQAASGNVFLDVGAGDFAASFIEQLFQDGITAGCGNNNYCPNATVTRDQIAVFLLRAKHGASYSPPPATGIFGDVDLSYWAVHWIEQLAAEGITAGCGGVNYCPDAPVTRDQMAVFLVRTFGL